MNRMNVDSAHSPDAPTHNAPTPHDVTILNEMSNRDRLECEGLSDCPMGCEHAVLVPTTKIAAPTSAMAAPTSTAVTRVESVACLVPSFDKVQEENWPAAAAAAACPVVGTSVSHAPCLSIFDHDAEPTLALAGGGGDGSRGSSQLSSLSEMTVSVSRTALLAGKSMTSTTSGGNASSRTHKESAESKPIGPLTMTAHTLKASRVERLPLTASHAAARKSSVHDCTMAKDNPLADPAELSMVLMASSSSSSTTTSALGEYDSHDSVACASGGGSHSAGGRRPSSQLHRAHSSYLSPLNSITSTHYYSATGGEGASSSSALDVIGYTAPTVHLIAPLSQMQSSRAPVSLGEASSSLTKHTPSGSTLAHSPTPLESSAHTARSTTAHSLPAKTAGAEGAAEPAHHDEADVDRETIDGAWAGSTSQITSTSAKTDPLALPAGRASGCAQCGPLASPHLAYVVKPCLALSFNEAGATVEDSVEEALTTPATMLVPAVTVFSCPHAQHVEADASGSPTTRLAQMAAVAQLSLEAVLEYEEVTPLMPSLDIGELMRRMESAVMNRGEPGTRSVAPPPPLPVFARAAVSASEGTTSTDGASSLGTSTTSASLTLTATAVTRPQWYTPNSLDAPAATMHTRREGVPLPLSDFLSAPPITVPTGGRADHDVDDGQHGPHAPESILVRGTSFSERRPPLPPSRPSVSDTGVEAPPSRLLEPLLLPRYSPRPHHFRTQAGVSPVHPAARPAPTFVLAGTDRDVHDAMHLPPSNEAAKATKQETSTSRGGYSRGLRWLFPKVFSRGHRSERSVTLLAPDNADIPSYVSVPSSATESVLAHEDEHDRDHTHDHNDDGACPHAEVTMRDAHEESALGFTWIGGGLRTLTDLAKSIRLGHDNATVKGAEPQDEEEENSTEGSARDAPALCGQPESTDHHIAESRGIAGTAAFKAVSAVSRAMCAVTSTASFPSPTVSPTQLSLQVSPQGCTLVLSPPDELVLDEKKVTPQSPEMQWVVLNDVGAPLHLIDTIASPQARTSPSSHCSGPYSLSPSQRPWHGVSPCAGTPSTACEEVDFLFDSPYLGKSAWHRGEDAQDGDGRVVPAQGSTSPFLPLNIGTSAAAPTESGGAGRLSSLFGTHGGAFAESTATSLYACPPCSSAYTACEADSLGRLAERLYRLFLHPPSVSVPYGAVECADLFHAMCVQETYESVVTGRPAFSQRVSCTLVRNLLNPEVLVSCSHLLLHCQRDSMSLDDFHNFIEVVSVGFQYERGM